MSIMGQHSPDCDSIWGLGRLNLALPIERRSVFFCRVGQCNALTCTLVFKLLGVSRFSQFSDCTPMTFEGGRVMGSTGTFG
jgi:hypothetical protein